MLLLRSRQFPSGDIVLVLVATAQAESPLKSGKAAAFLLKKIRQGCWLWNQPGFIIDLLKSMKLYCIFLFSF
jgi:hypothetical protein